MITLEGFRRGTTQICLENEDTWGGSRKSSKVFRGDHLSEVILKGGIGEISPCVALNPPPPPRR